jgi:hypothetical protein
MISPELENELKLIAYCDAAKPVNRVAALSSLARNGIDLKRVRETLYSIATDISTPDSVKIRAIDLIDKLDISTAPKELKAEDAKALEQSLLEKYVGTT